MEAIISNFRRSRHTTYDNHMIILVDGVDNREKAAKLIGKSVTWIAPGKEKKEFKGKISAAHGNKGALRVLFEKGMPGQSVGNKVNIA